MASVGLMESLKLINGAGVPAIEDHVRALQEKLLVGLWELPAWRAEAQRSRGLFDEDRLGPILALHHQGLGAKGLNTVLQRGIKQGIYASVREGYLRIAFHGWHSDTDVDRILIWLNETTS